MPLCFISGIGKCSDIRISGNSRNRPLSQANHLRLMLPQPVGHMCNLYINEQNNPPGADALLLSFALTSRPAIVSLTMSSP